MQGCEWRRRQSGDYAASSAVAEGATHKAGAFRNAGHSRSDSKENWPGERRVLFCSILARHLGASRRPARMKPDIGQPVSLPNDRLSTISCGST